MINPENVFEMMNPSKVLEAFGQTKMFDVKTQSKLVEKAADQAFEMVGVYQSQTRKAMDFWMDQGESAMKQSQKLMKDWVAEFTKTGASLVSEVEANVKEAAKVFEVSKTAKATKAS